MPTLMTAPAVKAGHAVSNPPFRADPTRDAFLVSYPRSGNTWLRTVIASLQLEAEVGSLRELDFITPDIHARVPLHNVRPLPFYVVKSHEKLQLFGPSRNYRRVLYVVRDPRDVAISYHRYMETLRNYDRGLSEFVRHMCCGRVWPGSWQEHVASWTKWRDSFAGEMLVLRYEDIVAEPDRRFAEISSFLGLHRSAAAIEQIVAQTTPDAMRQRESAGNRKAIETGQMYFIGSASPGGWREKMEPATAELIANEAGAMMALHGYS